MRSTSDLAQTLLPGLRFPKSLAPLTRRAISTIAPVSPSLHPPPAALGEPAPETSPSLPRDEDTSFGQSVAYGRKSECFRFSRSP